MARQRKGEKGCEEANNKWRQTMIKKLGSEEAVSEFARRIGRKGGVNGRGPDYKGGFAADPERARTAGAKGGKNSRRTSKYIRIFEENKKAIDKAIKNRSSFKMLAEALGVPYQSLMHYISKNKK